jgi:hypothetical protein
MDRVEHEETVTSVGDYDIVTWGDEYGYEWEIVNQDGLTIANSEKASMTRNGAIAEAGQKLRWIARAGGVR